MNTHSFLPTPTPFFEGGEGWNFQKIGRGSNFLKNLWGKPKREGRGNAKVTGRMEFFNFHFLSLLAIPVTDTAVGKSSLENTFFKKVFLGTSKHWPNYADLLVFCLKLRLSPFREYLDYHYIITNDYWVILEKI